MVTNQAAAARGLYGIDDVAREHKYIAERLAEHGAHTDLFLYCPYHPAGVVEAFARTSAQAVGASAFYVGPDDCERPSLWSFPSLAAAAQFILEGITV